MVKARYQSHVWGKHQFKIYSENKKGSRPSHPYRTKGGVFIYPSIHWFLSRYKREAPKSRHEAKPTPLKTLNKILSKSENIDGGIPRGRCTAMIGERGTHKSHLGYYHILNNISKNIGRGTTRERGLIISLRDDVGLAMDAMTGLLSTSPIGDPPKRCENAEKKLEEYITNDDLEILYYPPGYITPEEFYHRVLMSLLRLKKSEDNENVNITVLFNSLDQLSSRFPLCAKEDVFIPGLIDTFTAEGVTSMFIAVDEPNQPPHQYGLLTMADLILTFHKRMFQSKDYFGHIQAVADNKQNADHLKEDFGNEIQTTVLRIERYAGEHSSSLGGILELVQKSPLEELYGALFNIKSRIVFTPFSPHYKQGEPF